MTRADVRTGNRSAQPGDRRRPGGGGRRQASTRNVRSAPAVTAPAPWRPVLALVLSVVGLGVSTYLTVAHFAKFSLVCSSSGIVNCERVTTSPQSYFLGIPVAFLGLLFFVGMTAVNLPVLWRTDDRRVHLLRLVMAILGMCFVLYLVSAELLIIKNICLWCTSVHVVTFALFVLMMTTVPQMLGWTADRRSGA